jgi:anti-sigma B factor antagonist
MDPTRALTPDDTAVPAQATRLTLLVEHQDDTVVLRASGEIDMLTAPQLEECVTSTLHDRPAMLVIDLTRVEFLSSAGIAALIAAQQQAGEHTRLCVVATGHVTFRPLELTGIDKELTIYSTLDHALATR